MIDAPYRDVNDLGGLWINQSAKGEYLSGTVNGVKVICFRNTFKKEGEKTPDWRVKRSVPKTPGSPTLPEPAPVDDSDVPF